MKTLYLVVESNDIGELEKANHLYRAIIVKGCTYTKEEFRKWVVDTFKAQPNSSMKELAKACARGGWNTIQIKIY